MGFVGVMTSLSGEQAPAGQFAQARQKGVRQDILQPGLYYINPKEYTIDVLEIGLNQVSLLGPQGSEVITKRQIASGNKATDAMQSNVLEVQRQKRAEYLHEQEAEAIHKVPVDRAGRPLRKLTPPEKPTPPAQQKAKLDDSIATFALNQFVEFPSRDGFDISLDMTVEVELTPEALAWVFRSYGDLPAVVDKIILPQILSVSRLKGSAYRAKDFIVGEGREKFQNDLTESLAATLKEKHIIVHNALIRHVGVPTQILEPIQQASIATEQDLTNKEMQNTARKQAELNTETTLIDQRREQVVQETERIKAEIKADQDKQVAEIRAEALKKTAEIEKDAAARRAEKTRKLGEADAKVIQMVEGEKANGQLLKAKAFGDPAAFSLWEFASQLNNNLKITILHSGPGTLWTDLDKARLGDLGGATVIGAPKPVEKKPEP
jgi:regulator of protease activity HflC (stomatin/prohibitin superfamily)